MTLDEYMRHNMGRHEISDIVEHLSTLTKYATTCEHVTEFGTRYGNGSTIALALGKPKRLVTYDINKCQNEQLVVAMCKNEGIHISFVTKSTTDVEIEKTHLLFIDTLHNYKQLHVELSVHSKNVGKYIILHDTITYGLRNETLDGGTEEGLKPAIFDFLKSGNGGCWRIHKEYYNNNGLMVLIRV